MENKEKNKPTDTEGQEEKAKEMSTIDNIFAIVKELERLIGTRVFAFLLMPMTLGRNLLEATYEILEQRFKNTTDLDVLVTFGWW